MADSWNRLEILRDREDGAYRGVLGYKVKTASKFVLLLRMKENKLFSLPQSAEEINFSYNIKSHFTMINY